MKVNYAAASTALSTGLNVGWSAAAIPHLLSGDLGFTVTSNDASWVVSLLNFGCLLSGFYTIYALDTLGRKATLTSAGLMFIAAWVFNVFISIFMAFLVFGNNIWYIYVGRTIAGMGFGTSNTAGITYISEIADKKIRGGLNTLLKLMIDAAMLIAFTVGGFVSYTASIYIYASITTVSCLLCAIMLPESPWYYIKKGQNIKAEKVFRKLRSNNDVKFVSEELDHMKKVIDEDMKNQSSVKEFLTNVKYRKCLAISFVMKTLLTASGYFIITSYLQVIVEDTGIKIAPHIVSIIIGCLKIVMDIIVVFIVDKFGRKKLLIISLVGIAISQIGIGTFFYLQDHREVDDSFYLMLSWLPLSCLVSFTIFYNIGVGPVTLILEGEIFPTNIKAAAMSSNIMFSNAETMIFVKLYQITADSWGMYVPFWTLSLLMVVGVAFVAFILPETKGQSFDVIQAKLNDGRFFKI